jgi:hypothetical protein
MRSGASAVYSPPVPAPTSFASSYSVPAYTAPPTCAPRCVCVCQSVCVSVCQSVCVSVCLSVCVVCVCVSVPVPVLCIRCMVVVVCVCVCVCVCVRACVCVSKLLASTATEGFHTRQRVMWRHECRACSREVSATAFRVCVCVHARAPRAR